MHRYYFKQECKLIMHDRLHCQNISQPNFLFFFVSSYHRVIVLSCYRVIVLSCFKLLVSLCVDLIVSIPGSLFYKNVACQWPVSALSYDTFTQFIYHWSRSHPFNSPLRVTKSMACLHQEKLYNFRFIQ
jgi:hypothetical protein